MGRCRNDWYEPLTGKIALTATIGQRHAAEILWHAVFAIGQLVFERR